MFLEVSTISRGETWQITKVDFFADFFFFYLTWTSLALTSVKTPKRETLLKISDKYYLENE